LPPWCLSLGDLFYGTATKELVFIVAPPLVIGAPWLVQH
jgi:hypothetical protein